MPVVRRLEPRSTRLAATLVMLAVLAGMAAPVPVRAAWPNAPALNLPVSTASASQLSQVVTPDGAGGAYVAWLDMRSGLSRIYAHHILATGAVDPAWPVDGLPVTTNAPQQVTPRIVSDGAGGALVSWEDARNFNWDVFAQRLIPTGLDPAWPATGLAVCTDPAGQNYHSSVRMAPAAPS